MSPSIGAEGRVAAVRHARGASGQVHALAEMIVAGDSFPAVAQQLLAARGSLDSLLIRLVELELPRCLSASTANDEINSLLRTALGRAAPGRAPARRCRRRSGGSTPRLERPIRPHPQELRPHPQEKG